MQYIMMFAANVCIAYIVIRKKKSGVCLFLIYICVFAYEFYIRITFGKTVGFLVFASFFWVLYWIDKKEPDLKIKVFDNRNGECILEKTWQFDTVYQIMNTN